MEVEQPGVGGRPGAVHSLGGVGHQHVGVELGVPGPGGPVLEAGGDQALGLDPVLPAGAPPDPEGVPLEVAEGPGHGLGVDPADHLGGRGVGEAVEEETDFGAEKVKSNPETRPSGRTRPAVRDRPSGAKPARTTRRSSGATSPASPSALLPEPSH